MKSLKLTFYSLILFFGLFCLTKSPRAATINATNCSVAAINSAISSATEGDTVNVPACSETVWPTGVTITKGIALKGAGIGVTNIAVPDAGLGSGNFLITYAPAHPENNAAFNLSGFTFNFKNMSPSSPLSLSLLIQNYDLSHVITKVRIHHNQWLNCACQDNPLTNNGFFVTSPGVWGLFDHNYVSGEFCERSDGTSAGIDPWSNQTFSYSTASNFY